MRKIVKIEYEPSNAATAARMPTGDRSPASVAPNAKKRQSGGDRELEKAAIAPTRLLLAIQARLDAIASESDARWLKLAETLR